MINLSVFRHFVPTHSLSPADRGELARHSYVAGYQPGQVLFHRGDAARTVAYLISGEVELVSELGSRLIAGDTDASRYALANGEKRNVTATCTRAAQVLFIDRNHLDLMLTWAQTGAVEVQDLQQGEAGDWMSAMLRNPAFHRIPPANIAQIIACVEQVEFAAGDTIIRQGEAGDYYYVVTDGICQVLLQDPTGLGERELDRIGQGQGFGEEALVSGDPRNATVRALSRVSLVRLAAQDFTRCRYRCLAARRDPGRCAAAGRVLARASRRRGEPAPATPARRSAQHGCQSPAGGLLRHRTAQCVGHLPAQRARLRCALGRQGRP